MRLMIREGALGERFQENESKAGCGGGGEVEVLESWRCNRENPKCGRRSVQLAVPFASNILLRSVNPSFQHPCTRFKEATHLY